MTPLESLITELSRTWKKWADLIDLDHATDADAERFSTLQHCADRLDDALFRAGFGGTDLCAMCDKPAVRYIDGIRFGQVGRIGLCSDCLEHMGI